ncbi:MAG: transposase [Firmicutes bacterium]|nr:transposase [Bacillota bacterium]
MRPCSGRGSPLDAKTLKVLWAFTEGKRLRLGVTSTDTYGCCPECGARTDSMHDVYIQTVIDRPIDNYLVELDIIKRRWKCTNRDCWVVTFGESIEGVRPRSRYTEAFRDFSRDLSDQLGYAGAIEYLQSNYDLKTSIATVFYASL